MWRSLLVVLITMVVAIGVSLLLIPGGQELALMKFRDRDYEEALPAYERRYADGDRSAATVIPLSRLHLQEGRVERAIAVMEGFIATEPKSVEARQLLGVLYRGAQRMGDYLTNLEAIETLAPSEETERELATLYDFYADFERLAIALGRLADRLPDDADVVTKLAAILAGRGGETAAVVRLQTLDDRLQGGLPGDARELLMSLLLELGREDEAVWRAARWLDRRPAVTDMLALGNQFTDAGRADLARDLLLPFEGRAGGDPAFALTLIDLDTATGALAEAHRRLLAFRNRGAIDDAWLGRFVALSFGAGQPRLALDAVRGRDLALVPDWALTGLAEAAFAEMDFRIVDRLTNELGDDFLGERPLLAANIALARGDAAGAARWASQALNDQTLPLVERLAAVGLLSRAGQRERATAALDRVVPDGDLPDEAAVELAELHLQLDRPKAGLAWVEARLRSCPSPALEAVWARMAARVGDASKVTAWLNSASGADVGVLQDIAAAASERGAVDLALSAARRAHDRQPTLASGLALANALVAAKQPEQALALIEPLLGGGGASVEELYAAALDAAGRTAELVGLWSARLRRADLPEEERKRLLYALLERKAHAAALPFLKDMAARHGGEWLFAYTDAARRSGATAELAAFLAARAQEDRQPAEERRRLAFLLLELGDKGGAERAFLKLGAGQGPDGSDVRQLLFLWGPRPPPGAMDWMERRARAAKSPAEQVQWYERLLASGGAGRVAKAITQGGQPESPWLMAVYIDALAARDDGAALVAALRTALPGERDPERLRRYARLAEQARANDVAADAWRALATLRPDDADALRQLGMLAFDGNRLSEAERHLRRYLMKRSDDYEANYFLGEALNGLKRRADAVPFWSRALDLLRSRGAGDPETGQAEANLLHRLGQVDEAVALFERLRRLRPNDRQLKADYVSVLIESGRMKEARHVLDR